MIRHRAFALIAASFFLIASHAHGQQPVHHIGFLANIRDPERMQAWEEGLRERGYVVGRNLDVEYRFFQGQTDRIPALLAELVALSPELIVTTTSNSAVVIHALAPTIPMVFLAVADPVALGLVKSLARPGGNVTGLATLDPKAFIAKQLEILKQLDPQASRIAVLMNPTYQMHQLALPKLPEAARLLGVQLVVVEASKADEYQTAFEKAYTEGADAIQIWNGPIEFTNSAKIIGLAAHYRLPAMYFERLYVQKGGLVSYAPNPADFWRGAAVYVDKILNGEKPSDIPVQQPTRYYLTVNLKTAKALGVTVPPSLLAQADEVFE